MRASDTCAAPQRGEQEPETWGPILGVQALRSGPTEQLLLALGRRSRSPQPRPAHSPTSATSSPAPGEPPRSQGQRRETGGAWRAPAQDPGLRLHFPARSGRLAPHSPQPRPRHGPSSRRRTPPPWLRLRRSQPQTSPATERRLAGRGAPRSPPCPPAPWLAPGHVISDPPPSRGLARWPQTPPTPFAEPSQSPRAPHALLSAPASVWARGAG